jgi:hypothetical protein
MATVTREFRNNFENWAQRKIDACHFTLAEIEDLRGLIRKDLTPGPDQLRGECEFLTAAGVKIPATIDDHEERYRLWESFFAARCKELEQYVGGQAAGINERIRAEQRESA